MQRTHWCRAFLPCLLVCSLSCSGNVDKITGAVVEVSESVERSTEKLREGMQRLSEIDPLALRTVLAENEDLRRQVVQLQSNLSFAQNYGVVEVGPGSEAKVFIANYDGSFFLRGWVNHRDNEFIRNALYPDLNHSLRLDYSIARNRLREVYLQHRAGQCEPFRSECMAGNLSIGLGSLGSGFNPDHLKPGWDMATELMRQPTLIDQRYKAAVDRAFKDYLHDPHARPSTGLAEHDVDLRLGEDGTHTVYLQVRPTARDEFWYIDYRGIVRRADGSERQFAVGRIDPNLNPVQDDGWTEPVAVTTFTVKLRQATP